MRDIKAMLPEEIAAALAEMGQPKYRAKQIFQWLARGVTSFDEMTNLSKDLRAALSERFSISKLEMLRKQVSAIDGTIKYLWQLGDGNAVETVVMHYKHGNTVCISSQVGCGMDCPFCATGKLGLTRNMSTGEIIEQVRVAAKMMRDGEVAGGEGRLSNIVFMGMGEPMGNYKSVLSAVRQISAMPPEGFGISARNITVSTVGVVPGIKKLTAEGIPVRLAVSLHAPSDELRDELVPMNKRFNTTQVLDAAHDYYLASKRRVSIEYAPVSYTHLTLPTICSV